MAEHSSFEKCLQFVVAARRQADLLLKDVSFQSDFLLSELLKGASTDNEILDFALLATSGNYDPDVISQYEDLSMLTNENSGKEVLVIQEASFTNATVPIILRNFSVAVLRQGGLVLDRDKQTIRIPVRKHWFRSLQFSDKIKIYTGAIRKNEDMLCCGVLMSNYADLLPARKVSVNGQSCWAVPDDAVTKILLLEETDWNSLSVEHGLDLDDVVQLRRDLIRRYSLQKAP